MIEDLPCKSARNIQPEELKWTPPDPGWAAVTVDGSFDALTRDGGVGIIVRNNMGQALVCACRYLPKCDDAFEAELMAIKEGILVAAEHTSMPFMLQTDCTKAVTVLSASNIDFSSLGHIVEDVKDLVRGNREFNLVKICRTQNRVADFLAKYSRREHQTNLWLHDVPSAVADLIAADCNPIL